MDPISNENHTPPLRLIAWNVTPDCNLSCSHCYMDANNPRNGKSLDTEEGFALIDQISEIGRPVMVLSGGEPLLREDIFELARYGTVKGLRMVMGTNGTLIDRGVAERLKISGIKKVANQHRF